MTLAEWIRAYETATGKRMAPGAINEALWDATTKAYTSHRADKVRGIEGRQRHKIFARWITQERNMRALGRLTRRIARRIAIRDGKSKIGTLEAQIAIEHDRLEGMGA